MQYTTTLSQVTQWYNKLHSTILDVELRLVEAEMQDVRRTLSPALRNLRWSQVELWDYIMRLYTYSDGIILIAVFTMFGMFFLTFNVHGNGNKISDFKVSQWLFQHLIKCCVIFFPRAAHVIWCAAYPSEYRRARRTWTPCRH